MALRVTGTIGVAPPVSRQRIVEAEARTTGRRGRVVIGWRDCREADQQASEQDRSM